MMQSAHANLEIVAASDVGRARQLNEDSVRALPAAMLNAAWQLAGVLVVSDGMGGHHGGEVASGLAADAMENFFQKPPRVTDAKLDGRALLSHLDAAIRAANAIVFEQAAPELSGAATRRPGATLTVCLLREDEYFIGHVGDSRAYLLRQNAEETEGKTCAEQLTDDDSFVAEAARRGHMTPEEARVSPLRNQITKAVGLEAQVEPASLHGQWSAGDVLLLCSDGLTEYLESQEIADAVFAAPDLETACHNLIVTANARGGSDNISICAARCAANISDASTPDVSAHEAALPFATSAASQNLTLPEAAWRANTRNANTRNANTLWFLLPVFVAGGLALMALKNCVSSFVPARTKSADFATPRHKTKSAASTNRFFVAVRVASDGARLKIMCSSNARLEAQAASAQANVQANVQVQSAWFSVQPESAEILKNRALNHLLLSCEADKQVLKNGVTDGDAASNELLRVEVAAQRGYVLKARYQTIESGETNVKNETWARFQIVSNQVVEKQVARGEESTLAGG